MLSIDPSIPDKKIVVTKVLLTSFTQAGRGIELGTAPETLERITLKSSANFFEFEFTRMSFRDPVQSQYAYMLEELDSDWILSSGGNGHYSKIPGGDYILKLSDRKSVV